MKRAAKVIAAALKDSDSCPLLLEQTAGHKGLLGRDFDETAELIELRRRRRAARPLPRLLPPLRAGLRHHRRRPPRPRCSTRPTRRSASSASRCVHVNDAGAPLGSCRDRHANVGEGEMGGGPRRLPLRAPLRGPAGDAGDARARRRKGPDRKESPGRQAAAAGGARSRATGETAARRLDRGPRTVQATRAGLATLALPPSAST